MNISSFDIYAFFTLKKLLHALQVISITAIGLLTVFVVAYFVFDYDVFFPSGFSEEEKKQYQENIDKFHNVIKITFIIMMVSLIATLFTPTPKELDILAVNQIIKQENLDTEDKTVFDIIDYIDTKVKELNDSKN